MIEGHQRDTIARAWWAERFARERRLRPLEKYLTPKKKTKNIDEIRKEYQDLRARLR